MKKKFFGLSLTLLLVFCLGLFCTSSSMAYTFDEFLEFTQQIKDANISAVFNHHADLILRYQNNIRSAINVNNYVSWVVDTQNSSTGYCRVLLFSNSMNISTSSANNGTITPGQNVSTSVMTISQNDGSVGTNSGLRVTSYTSARYFGLVETTSTITNWYQLKFNNFYTPAPQIYFTPEYDAHVNVSNITNVNALKYDYSVGQWYIGETTGFTDLHSFQFFLYDFTYNVEIGTINGNIGQHILNGTMALYMNNGNVYVNSRYMKYNHLYRLDIYKYSGETGQNTSTEYHYFVFLPLNATISNGMIIDAGSGDFTSQDSTNQIIDSITDSNQADNTVNDFFSGDANSFADKMGFSPLENPFVAVIQNTLETITDILLGTGDQTLEIGFGSQTYILRSQDFKLPDGIIKGFISAMSNAFFVWIIVKYGFQLYQWINTGRLQNLVNEANGHWYKALF